MDTSLTPASGKLGLLVCGGPAPGINSVLGAATIRARLAGVEVIGIHDGFKHLMEGDTSRTTSLEINTTSRIHFNGGSYIGISRGSPCDDPVKMQNTLGALERLGVNMLITIGGDGTAYVARVLSEAGAGALRIVHVPKTIDNDIDLPLDMPTFGFQTARHVGVELVENLMVDARTTSRWYFVVTQGRKSGHLALATGKAAGATLSLIPEEFSKDTPMQLIVDTLVGAMIKRLAGGGKRHGVAMLAEGLAGVIRPKDLARFTNVPMDVSGSISFASINLGDVIERAVAQRLKELGIALSVHGKEIGYELRCAAPIPYDMEYTRDLGYCAARHILEGGDKVVVSMQNGRFVPIPFDDLVDKATGKTRVRMVDLESDRYKIARTYMVRLGRSDFASPEEVKKLGAVCGLSPEDFRAAFEHVVKA